MSTHCLSTTDGRSTASTRRHSGPRCAPAASPAKSSTCWPPSTRTTTITNESTITIVVDGFPSRPLSVRAGVRQGCPASPLLFDAYIDLVMRCFACKCWELYVRGLVVKSNGPSWAPAERNLSYQLCADDQALLYPSLPDLQAAAGILQDTARE
eukprot:286098-Chlamydomonas_euryale.AAC.2